MKNTYVKTLGTMALAILLSAIFAQIQVSAQDIVNEEKIEIQSERLIPTPHFGNPQALVGTWDVQVRIFNCQNNQTIRTFASMGSYNLGGTSVATTSGGSPLLRTPELGVWNHINGRNFRFKAKTFTFDTGGNFTGWVIITQTAEVSPGADSFTSTGIGEFFDQSGNPTPPFRGCSSTTAVRFE